MKKMRALIAMSVILLNFLSVSAFAQQSTNVLVTHNYLQDGLSVHSHAQWVPVETGMDESNPYESFLRPSLDGAHYEVKSFTITRTPKGRDFSYAIYYYKDSIEDRNLLGKVEDISTIGEEIPVDLYLFVPQNYTAPGIRSGATHISSDETQNAVFVVYRQAVGDLRYYASYYTLDSDGNFDQLDIDFWNYEPPAYTAPYGTVIHLTDEQLNPSAFIDYMESIGYERGIQMDGPVAIVQDGQVIRVLFREKELVDVTINHYVEDGLNTGVYNLFTQQTALAFVGDRIISVECQIGIPGSYVYRFALPESLVAISGYNEINLYYDYTPTRSLSGEPGGNKSPNLAVMARAFDESVLDMTQGAGFAGYTASAGQTLKFSDAFVYEIAIDYQMLPAPPPPAHGQRTPSRHATPIPEGNTVSIEDGAPPLAAFPNPQTGRTPRSPFAIGIAMIVLSLGLFLSGKQGKGSL